MTEQQIEQSLIAEMGNLKYTYRQDIRDRAALEQNFRAKFKALIPAQRPRFSSIRIRGILFSRR